MSGLLLLIIHVWSLSLLLFSLHYISPRFGFTPFLMTVGALTVFTQSRFSIYVEPFPDLFMFISSNMFIPVIVMAVLLIYVTNGAAPARMTLYSILGVCILTLIGLVIFRLYMLLPDGGSLRALTADQLMPELNLRITLASLLAFAVDMTVIVIVYQGLRNAANKMPEWLVVGAALLAALWSDALVFRFVSDLGTPDFVALMPGDVLGKTLSALILWLPLAYYTTRIAPRLPGYVGASSRSTFDLFIGSLREVRQALTQAEQKLAVSEAVRKREEEYIRVISEHVDEALWLVARGDYDHAFYVNPAYERLWGRTAAEIYADQVSFMNSLHPEDRARVMANLPKQMEGYYETEYRIIRPDSTLRWIRDRAFPVRDENGQVYRIAGISEDITERKQMERQRLELEMEREKVNLLRDFIGETSHDLKNPLTSLQLKLEMLTRVAEPERRAKHLKEALDLVERMNKLINDLLMLARLENLNELHLVRLNLQHMIRESCAAILPLIDEKQLELKVEVDNRDVTLLANEGHLSRALSNLIENAVNYTPQGGVVSVAAASSNGEIVIRVTDTGIGIPLKEQATIFNRFYRASNARSLAGTGLGLSLVKKVIDQHQGRIEVQSAEGTGTTFTAYLPKAS